MTDKFLFPDGFLWGAATSAYQVEGSPLADGAGPSIWQRFTHSPGLVLNNETGDVACDHYRRYEEDVRLMRELGLNAYRFSVSWSRVLPEGKGQVNEKGLDFYRRLVDALLENGIRPNVTLYHWDLPAALDDRGGWLNPDISKWFADYARVLFQALDDKVEMWATLNEPWVVTDGGYLHGALAPGHKNLYEAPLASHNLLLSHAAAVEAYRAFGKHRIGLVVNIEPKYPASDRPEDLAATKRADAYMNRQYLDPVFLGSYPEEMREIFGEAWPDFPQEDFDRIRQPIDFLGINYYTRSVTKNDPSALPVRAGREPQPRHAYTETSWEVYPQGLTDTLVWAKERYGSIPLYVTENGAAFYDPPVALADPHPDPFRVAYLREHLKAVHRAIEQGVDLRGYFAWSLLDNFEWSLGYSKRFGIIHVDLETQKRTMKQSARFYAEVIRTRGGVL
ncbi:MAG TPA: GH1 family beta-glucosidase [Thermoanaerobaculia bacterium]|nr:GH1 family beta-glucosidase [Thermoanaerobaculia bacterium]